MVVKNYAVLLRLYKKLQRKNNEKISLKTYFPKVGNKKNANTQILETFKY